MAEQPDALIERLASANLTLAGRAAADCLSSLPEERVAQLRQGLLARSRNPGVALAERIDAAEALGLMGDVVRYERLGGCSTSAYLLPRRSAGPGGGAGWIRVPGGTHALGSRRRPPEVEAIDCGPGGEPVQVELASFELAFAPVTNAEFALFVEDGGYEDTRWRPDTASARWLRGELRDEAGIAWQMRRHAALIEDFETGMDRFFNRRTAANLDFARSILVLSAAEAKARFESIYPMSGQPPAFMDVPEFANPLQPVVGVSVFEAEAYPRWLSAQSGLHIRLPTEAEWDAAARGAHARAWPWGDDESRSCNFNNEALGLGQTSPVGVFPGSDTPEGAVDMAGNVWEWSSSAYTPEGIDALATRRAPRPDMLRAIRGGCHQFEPNECRPDYRFKSNPLMRNKIIGFRLVCDPAAPGPTPHTRAL